ncbi:uncharacterized protein [Rutidosis leptorrhynchoides]|uniref:uncharacterized protein n=1 Tax=Rutidosis leptorrhynchoides TaxID=125765 RepID=UPI003A99A048
MNQLDYQNSLFLHPSEGPGSLAVQEKLTGAQNYRSWRRSIEIALSTKRKIGFITGTIARSITDNASAEQWDTCNNMVISWLMNSVSDSIAKSIMFIGTTVEIWKQLEKRFALSNGSRKYKLHKETYAMVQQDMIINEYYTKLKIIWEELDSMNQLPRVTNVTPEINAFLAAYNQQKEELHLFQFPNGLDEHYSSIRSQLLLMTPLHTVKSACSMLLNLLGFLNLENVQFVKKGHSTEKCWEKIGYPVWHYKYKLQERSKQNSGKVKSGQPKRSVANVQGSNVVFTSEKFEQLLKCLPQLNKNDMQSNDDSGNEIDHHFTAGATDHITHVSKYLSDSKSLFWKPKIRLPNVDSFVISHVGNITLNNGMNLKGVLVVPEFKFSLLSVPKLTKDKSCAMSTSSNNSVSAPAPSSAARRRADQPLIDDPINHYMATITHMTRAYSNEKRINALSDCMQILPHNEVSYSFVKYKTPYEVLLKKIPTYDHLRVFGFLAMAKPASDHNVTSSTSTSQPVLRRSQRNINPPTWKNDYVMTHVPVANQVSSPSLDPQFQSYITALLAHSDPAHFYEAINDPGWCTAMDDKLRALEANDTWEITSLPQHKKAISCH